MEQETNIRLDEINWRTIIRDIIHFLPTIVLAALIGLMGVGVYKNVLYRPQYTAGMTFAITNRSDSGSSSYFALTTSSTIADIYTSVFEGDVMRGKIEEVVGELEDNVVISADQVTDTNLIVLNISARDPRTAYTTALALEDCYHNVTDYLYDNVGLKVVQKPQVPMEPANPFRPLLYSFAGAVACGFLMGALVVLMSLLRNTVKNTRSARRNLEGDNLGLLPFEEKNRTLTARVKKSNKGLLLTNPTISFRFEEAFNQLASRIDYKMQHRNYQVLMVTSVAENEGKSTVAANLAMAMGERNKRILMIDLDLAKPALHKLMEYSVKGQKELKYYMAGEATAADIIISDSTKRNLSAIINSQAVANSQEWLLSDRIRALVEFGRSAFDYVILDTQPMAVGVDAEYVMSLADASVLVVRQDGVPIPDINDAIVDLQDGSSEFLGYILNGFDSAGTAYGHYSNGSYGNYGSYGKKIQRTGKRTGEKV